MPRFFLHEQPREEGLHLRVLLLAQVPLLQLAVHIIAVRLVIRPEIFIQRYLRSCHRGRSLSRVYHWSVTGFSRLKSTGRLQFAGIPILGLHWRHLIGIVATQRPSRSSV